MPAKIVEGPHYHLWTDALHGRALAHQARNKWDRGTYVRWTVTTAWTALEVACQDALQEEKISYSFRKNLDEAIDQRGFPPLDWGQGLWQRVQRLQDTRKGYVHRFIHEGDLFPEAVVADSAIDVVRKAIIAIYDHAGATPPSWVDDNEDRGWDSGSGSHASCTVIRAGASEDDPKAVRICYTHKGREHVSEILPPGRDPQQCCEELIRSLNVSVTAVRAYVGDKMVYEKQLSMRGGA
mgnify:CR=1 FL=1